MSPSNDKWTSGWEFICSCISCSVGLGNLWRFPYVAYKNGGAAFLLPYIVVNVLVGWPIYYLELLLGQFSGYGPLGAFRMSPMFQGNAFGMMWSAFVTTVYYQMVITYAVLYLYHSFKKPLPWSDCFEWWGVPLNGCFVRRKTSHVCGHIRKSLVLTGVNDSQAESPMVVTYGGRSVLISQSEYINRFAGCIEANSSSTEVFFYRKVLNMSSSFEEVGFPQTNLIICYSMVWVLIFLLTFKGVKVVGKVVMVTATAPYVILTVMAVRGVTLQGSQIGLRYLLVLEWKTLRNADVWRAAIEQTFYSLCIGTGCLITYGAYQPFRQDIGSSVIFICFVDFFTSVFACVVVFAVLGNMADTLAIPIADVVSAGPGLAFVTYPEALSFIPYPNLWSGLFFSILVILGIDAQMATCILITDSIQDLFPPLAKQRTIAACLYCSFCFLVGLALTTQAGLYILTILDNYLGAFIVLFTCLGETIIVGWVYGMRRFCFDVSFMTGACPSYLFFATIKYFTPLSLAIFLVHTLHDFPRSNVGTYLFPLWADLYGCVLAAVGLAPILIIAFAKLRHSEFSWRRAASPDNDWGPHDIRQRALYWRRLEELGFIEEFHSMRPTVPTLKSAEIMKFQLQRSQEAGFAKKEPCARSPGSVG